MKVFSQNSKMKKTSNAQGIDLYNFGIPAFQSSTGLKTCPNAGACAAGCYARSGTYGFSNVKSVYEQRLELTQSSDFVERIGIEIDLLLQKAQKNGRQLALRIHDSGDFYSPAYQSAWYHIARAFPEVIFYAYTKQVAQSILLSGKKPSNFTLIYSYGGKQDHLIRENDRNSKVFESLEELKAAGYDDVSDDDSIAWTSKSGKIGLVYHGAKNFENTLWSKVA